MPASASNSSFSRSLDRRVGAVAARKEFPWMRLECQHAARNSKGARLHDQPVEHRAVAAVHAVEVADREAGGSRPRTGGNRA
jgi:hypothetical protein